MTRLHDLFPGAPEGAALTEEGWLVIGDEAWTEEDWRIAIKRSDFRRELRNRVVSSPPKEGGASDGEAEPEPARN